MTKSKNSKDKGLMLSESKIHELIREHYELLVAVGGL